MTAEIRTAVPPEVGVPIPLGDAECRNCTNGFVMGLCGPEDCGCDSGRVPVVPTCQTCGGMGERHEELDVALLISCVQVGSGDWSWEQEFDILRSREHEDVMAELRPSIAQDGIRDAVIIGTDGRVWDGHHRICVADELNARIPVCWLCPDCTDGVARRWSGVVIVAGGQDDCQPEACELCLFNEHRPLPDRRFHVEGDVVPVVDDCDDLPGAPALVEVCGPTVRYWPEDVCELGDEIDVTAAFPVPPAVGTWAVVPETIEEEA